MRVRRSIEASITVKQRLLSNAELVSAIATVSQILIEALKKGNKPLLFGNGGSAADAQHIAAEFVGRFAFDRPALAALALSVNTSSITAIGNDYGFDAVFARQVEAWVAREMSPSASRPAAIRPTSSRRWLWGRRWDCTLSG